MRCYFIQDTKPDKTTGEIKHYPCGHCVACRHNDCVSWSIRSYFESLSHNSSVFLTLTYDDEHLLPSNTPDYSGNLSAPHVRDFFKRLRYYNGESFRYFLGAEYGETTFRPHYHILLFGVDITSPAFTDKLWVSSKDGYNCICKAWDKGFAFLQPLSVKSCFYTCKYSLKYTQSKKKLLTALGMQPPFRRMSKGLGYDYFSKNRDEIITRGYIKFKGSKITIPRYFFDKALPVGSKEREGYVYNRMAFYKNYNSKEIEQYMNFVGKDKTYYSLRSLYYALGDQQELNHERR